MNFREEIQDMLRLEGLTTLEANKTIFAIAAIGLLIGKESLLEITYQSRIDSSEFMYRVNSLIDNPEEKEIANIALSFIPKEFKSFMFVRSVEIITKFDLEHIVLDLGIYEELKDKGGEYSTSCVEWINSLVEKLFRIHGGKSIYNCDCGTGDFVVRMLKNFYVKKAIGTTYKEQNAQIDLIKRFFLHQNLEIVNSNTFFSPALKEKVDMIYCTYPLIYKYEKEDAIPMIDSWNFHFDFNRKYSANLLWIINALQSIKDDGIVISLVANGVLFNGIDEEVRRYLVINNYIDTIISLPEGIIPSTGAAISLIILKRNRENSQPIKMIDASGIYTDHRRYKYFSQDNIAQIIDLYINDNPSDNVISVTIDEIMSNGAYLGMNRYFTCNIENAVTLDSVIDTIFRGYQLNAKELDALATDEGEETEYRIINISDIQAEGFVSDDLQPIKYDDKKKYDKFIVEDGDIIITAKNTTIKSAIYRSNGEYKAVLSGNLIAIRVNPKRINPYYLKAFIDSEKGDMAIKSIQTGTSIITINANSLRDMKISLLSMSEQEIIGNEYKNNLDLIIDLVERYKTATNYSNQIFERLKKDSIRN